MKQVTVAISLASGQLSGSKQTTSLCARCNLLTCLTVDNPLAGQVSKRLGCAFGQASNIQTGYIRVDNISYVWMGLPNVPNETNYYVTQSAYKYTPTSSIFTMEVAGLVGMTITFLSPVLPETILEMSLPYSYMNVEVYSLTGKHHSIQLYTDISAGQTHPMLPSHKHY